MFYIYGVLGMTTNIEPVYFKKIQYNLSVMNGYFKTLLIDLEQKELSYQIAEHKYPSGLRYNPQGSIKVKNYKTDFKAVDVKLNPYNEEIVFSYGLELSEEDISNILPYCNALEFEPYRNKKQETDQKGYLGYLDEAKMKFIGVSFSYLPIIELPMNYIYDDLYAWPHQLLYRAIYDYIISKNKKLKKYIYRF